jgi:hypothetical protein
MEKRRLQAIEEQKGLMNIGGAITGNDLKRAQSGNPAGQSISDFQALAADSMNRFTAGNDAQYKQYQMNMAYDDAQGPSTG